MDVVARDADGRVAHLILIDHGRVGDFYVTEWQMLGRKPVLALSPAASVDFDFHARLRMDEAVLRRFGFASWDLSPQ